jgi:hypothetical protein
MTHWCANAGNGRVHYLNPMILTGRNAGPRRCVINFRSPFYEQSATKSRFSKAEEIEPAPPGLAVDARYDGLAAARDNRLSTTLAVDGYSARYGFRHAGTVRSFNA